MTLTRKWSLLATLLIVAILVAGWFLLVSPKRGEAASLREQATSQQEANDRLLQQLDVLKAQQAELPEQRAKLAVMGAQIPDNPALPTLIRNLTAAGRKVGVSIDTMAPALPTPIVATQPTAPVTTAETTGSSDASAGTESTGTATAPAAPAPVAPSLYQVPLTLDVSGSYFELEQFVNKLEGLKRSFLVTGFTLGVEKEGVGTEAESTAGDLSLSLQGRVFLSPALAPAVTTPAEGASAPAAPATDASSSTAQ